MRDDGKTELRDARERRLKIRSWRRGTREMDLILGPFADARLGALSAEQLDRYEALLGENDQDLYIWFSGRASEPEAYRDALADLRTFHKI